MSKRKIPNLEERQLGLDPNKYTQTPWNAGNYKTSDQSPLKKLRDQYDEANNNLPDSTEEYRKSQEWFQRPEQKELANELGIEFQHGMPVLSDEDAEALEGPINNKMSERTIKLLKLMGE